MSESSSAEEHLRVIRSLMERATIYRAISAPAAVIGGVLAGGAALLGARGVSLPGFLGIWSGVLVLAMAVNFHFLHREAVRRGTVFFSAGMRMALLAMAPPLLVGLAGTFLLREASHIALLWVTIYGLALLSTSHFAPRSLVWLGACFLGAGLLAAGVFLTGLAGLNPHVLLGATFGGFHLLYAACAWPRQT